MSPDADLYSNCVTGTTEPPPQQILIHPNTTVGMSSTLHVEVFLPRWTKLPFQTSQDSTNLGQGGCEIAPHSLEAGKLLLSTDVLSRWRNGRQLQHLPGCVLHPQ
jgi:hypothetical protein